MDNEYAVFEDVYSVYLEELSTEDIPKLRTTEIQGIFRKSRTESNTTIKTAVANYLKNQAKTQMYDLWKKNTSTKNPSDWSSKNRTPILCMISNSEYDEAKREYDQIKSALKILSSTFLPRSIFAILTYFALCLSAAVFIESPEIIISSICSLRLPKPITI